MSTNLRRSVINYQAEPSIDNTGNFQVLALNMSRNYLLIYNGTNTQIWLRFGTVWPNGFTGLLIDPGVTYEPLTPPCDAVYLKAASGNPTPLVIEGITA